MRIVAAALQLPCGRVISAPPPARHHDLFYLLAREGAKHFGCVQGFITDQGDFIDRHVAWSVAEKAGQLLPGPRLVQGILFSENVW